MGTATFPWLTAMLAHQQHCRIDLALDLLGGRRDANTPGLSWQAHRRGTGHWPGSPGRPCEPEANEQGLVDLRSDLSEMQGRTRSRGRYARAAALPEASEKFSYGAGSPGSNHHQVPRVTSRQVWRSGCCRNRRCPLAERFARPLSHSAAVNHQ